MSLTGQIYANIDNQKIAPAVQQMKPWGNAVKQDDSAKFHICP